MSFKSAEYAREAQRMAAAVKLALLVGAASAVTLFLAINWPT